MFRATVKCVFFQFSIPNYSKTRRDGGPCDWPFQVSLYICTLIPFLHHMNFTVNILTFTEVQWIFLKFGSARKCWLSDFVITFFSNSLNDVVCFGVGAGANVLTELAVSSFVESEYMYSVSLLLLICSKAKCSRTYANGHIT